MANYDEWDKMVDGDELAKELETLESGGSGEYWQAPDGEYEVSLEDLKIKGSKKDNAPYVAFVFKIVAGEHKNKKIYVNEVFSLPFKIHEGDEMMRKMVSENGGRDIQSDEIKYKNMKQYAGVLADVLESVNGKREFLLKVGSNSKGYQNYKIEKVYTD